MFWALPTSFLLFNHHPLVFLNQDARFTQIIVGLLWHQIPRNYKMTHRTLIFPGVFGFCPVLRTVHRTCIIHLHFTLLYSRRSPWSGWLRSALSDQRSRGGDCASENFIKVIDFMLVEFSAFNFIGPGESREPCGRMIFGLVCSFEG